MATGAKIIEPSAPSMEHASGMLDQIATEFALGELKKPHVEMHQPLQAMESTEELVITNGCKTEESVRVEYEGNGRPLEGESFSESPPSAKVAAEKNEAGEVRCEEADETSMHEKQPLGDVSVGEEHGHKTDEAELEVIKEEKTSRETSREESTPIIDKEVSTLEKGPHEIESEKFDLEDTERNLGEMNGAKPGETGIECKSEDTDTLVNEKEVSLLPEEATDSISVSMVVIDSVVVGEDEQGLTGQSKSVSENPEDCVSVAAEATVITEEKTPSPSQVDGFQREEDKEDKDELDLPLVQEEETITSKPAEMETEEIHEVASCKPEEEVTEKDEPPSLKETPTEDAYEASKSAEIPVPIHPPTEERLPAVEEAGHPQCEADYTEIEKLKEVSDFEPKEQVDEEAEGESKASKEAEDAIDKDHSLEQDMPLTEEENRADDVIEEDASVLKAGAIADDVVIGCPPEVKSPLLVDEAEPLNNGVNDTEAEKLNEIPSVRCKEQITEENEAPMAREAQAEDISDPNENKEITVSEQPSMEKEDLPLDQEASQLTSGVEDMETEELKTGSVDMEVEKLDDISNFESKKEVNGEHEIAMAREIQAEGEYETRRDSEGVIAEHSSLEKECEVNQTDGDRDTTEQMTEETNASEASAGSVTGTDATDCLKGAKEEQAGIEIGHDTEAPSASPEVCHSTEEVVPAADEKEAEIAEPKEDAGNAVALKDEATEASAAFAEEHEVAPSSENAEPGSSKDTSEEANDEPFKRDHENSVTVPLVGEGDIKEVKSVNEEPDTNVSTSEEAAPIEDEVGTEVKEPEIEIHARSTDIPLEEIDTKEDDNSNLDEGKEKESPEMDDEETNASEASAGPVTGTDATDCMKEAEEEQPEIEIGQDTEAPSASPEDCHSAEEVTPVTDAKEAETAEPKEDSGNVVACKDEATEASAALSEEHEVAPSAEKASPDVPLQCNGENSITVPLVGESDIKEVKSGDEEPIANDSTSEEAAPIEYGLGAEVKEPEIENNAQSADIPLEEIDTKEDNTSNLDEGKEETPVMEDNVEKAREIDKHEEVTCDKLSTEIPENSPILLPPEEVIEASMEVAEAPEHDRKIDEILFQEEEKLKNENEQNEVGEDIYVAAEMQSEEKVHNPEDEILMSNETEDMTDQSKMDEPKVSDESSPNQNMQAEESEKAEPLPVSSLLEKAILEGSMASSENPVEELGKDHKTLNIEVESKPDVHIIEEVIDSADTGKEISNASAPSSEDHGYEAISGTEHETVQEPNESPIVDVADKIMDRECMPNEISESDRHETVNETTNATEVIEEHEEPEKATEDEKEVKKVQRDIDLESSLDSDVGEEELKTTREVVETQEASLRSHEETIEAETREKNNETAREVVSGTEAPEISTEFEDADKQTTSEEGSTVLEPEKQCERTAEENDSTEEKVTSEEVRDADILMRDASVDVTDQGKVDEPKETDENSANQNIQMDDSGCEKPGDEALNNAEPLPASSQTEEIILEERTASKNLDEDLGEDSEVIDSSDTGKETDRHETVNKTTDAAEVIEEHHKPEKATEDEKEVKVQQDINIESSPNSEVGEEKCVEEEEVRTIREVVETQEANIRSREETIEEETQAKDSETTREAVPESKAPEISTEFEDANKQTSSEEVTTSLEPEKQCENDFTEEKVTSEEVRDADILMRDASVDITDQGKADEQRETDENSANQDIQMGDGGCEKSGDEALNNAEPLPARSEPEKIILEERTASNDPDEELREDDKSENAPVDSKPVADIIEQNWMDQVNDSADAEISCASEPALEDQGDEVLPGAKEDTFQKPDQDLSADDVNEFRGQVCVPAVAGGVEVKETMESVSETERHESVDGTTDAVELTEERDDIEKTDEYDKEVKVQYDVNTESVLVAEVTEEKCLEGEDVPTSRAPEPEVEVSESVALTAPVEDEADDQSNKETGKPETEVIDTETAREVVSGTEVTELPAKFEDADKQTSFEEATGSSEPEKQSEKATGADDPAEEKASAEEVDDGEVKTRESESLEKREIDEVGDSNVIHATSPVECAAVEEVNTVPVLESTEAGVENVHPEEIIARGSECETTTEDLVKEKVQDVGSDFILETEDAAEEASSNPTILQCIPEQEIATKDAAAQDPDNELEGSKVVAEEACGSKHPETEVVDAVDGAFEEEKSELTGITGETNGISREMDVSDSQCTESVSMEETNSHQSRELETRVLAPVSDVIPETGENETGAMVEETTEENEVVMLQENEALPCAAEVTEFEEQQQTVDGDTEANEGTKGISSEADTEGTTKVEDLVQETLKEDTKTADIEASIGEEAIATADFTDLSLEKAETTPEPSPEVQMEETVVSENSESLNVNVVEATVDANKPCENIVERSNDEEHHGVGDVDESASMRQVIDKDDIPEERDFSTVSTDYDETAVKVELTREENEEVLTVVNELSAKEETAIPEAHGEQKVVPVEQPRTMVGVTEEENVTDVAVQESESLELSSAAEVAKDECIEKDKQIEDVASAANEATKTRSLIFQEETVEASKEYENAVGADGIIQDDIPNEKDDSGHGKAHEGESSEDAKPTCEISSESLAVGEEGDSVIISGEGISENEASASSVIAAEADNDEGQMIVSAAVADDVEEHVEEKVSEVAETPYQESNDAATLTTEATVVKSREAEKDEHVNESDRDILTGNALETDDIKRDGILVEEAHVPHGEADESTSLKEEVIEKACITKEIHATCEERDSISVPAEDIAAKDLDEQIQVGNIEAEANATSAGDSPITDVLESDVTVDEQVSTSMEEIKEVKEVEKEIPEEAGDCCEKIDHEVPEISLSEAERDQKPVEKTAETETGHGPEEPEEVLTTVCPSTEELGGTEKASGPANGSIDHAEATAVVEEVTVKNTEVGGRELESGGVPEKIIMETAEVASVTEEMEETVKEAELHDENLQSAPAPEAAEEVCLEKAEEMSTEATESEFVKEEVEETAKEVELQHDENLPSAFAPEATEEICLEKAEEISTEAAESAYIAEEIEQTTKDVELRHDENLQSAAAPVPAEEVCSERAEEVTTTFAESVSVTEDIEETTKEVELRQDENLRSAPAPDSAEEACSEKAEEVTTNTAESVSMTEDIDETAKDVELRHDQNVESAFTPEATDEACLEKAEDISTRAAESVSVTEEIEETTKEVELQHDNNLQSAPAPKPAKEVCSENAEEMSTIAAESLSAIESHKVSSQLEDAEIIEKHFEVATANSVVEEPAEKIADEISPGIASAEKPVYPFVQEQETRQPEEIHKENRLKDEEVTEEEMETLTSTVNELRNQEEKRFKAEDAPGHKEVGETNGEIVQEEKVSTAIPEGEGPSERSLCKTMETVILTGKDDAATIEKPEESILGPYQPEHGTAEVVCTPGGKALEEPADAADVSLSDLLKKPATETLQATTRAVESSLAETKKAEEAKIDEEKDEHEADEDDHRELSPEHDTPVMVESAKDTDVKTPHKKSHNILSGVGTKVKHSISKVKKAITGKSSPSKTVSPPKHSS